MTRAETVRFLIIPTIGNFLLLFAIFGVFAMFGPTLYYELQFKVAQVRGVRYLVSEEKSSSPQTASGLATVLASPKEQILIPKDTEFSILILKIGVNAKVFPNIDPAKQEEFLPILQKGVAHAKGTVFPGMRGSIYLFAHSTNNFWDKGRHNAFFYLLKELNVGDEIIVFFQNRRYNYVMSESRIVDPSDVSYLTKTQEGQEVLILQTCWPPGTTWKRLLVLAKPR